MNLRPRVAINLTYLIPGEVGGSETVIQNVLPAWTPLRRDWQFILLTTSANHDSFADDLNVRRHLVGVNPRKKIERLLWEQFTLPGLLRDLSADVLFSPAYYGPVRWSGRHVVFVHDMNFQRHPEDFGRLHRAILRKLVPATCQRANRILTNSYFSKSEISNFYPDLEPRIAVSHFGSDHVTSVGIASPSSTKPFFLCVARWYPHKNLPLLIRAFTQSGLAREFRLVMVGGGSGAREASIAEVAQAGLQNFIEFRSGLEKSQLVELFEHCHMLVSPSNYEGFGLPLLEAMRLRTPILCTDLPVHREVTNSHAHFFSSDDADELANKLRDLAYDAVKRGHHVEPAYQYAIQQTWLKTADVFAEVFEEVLRSR